MKKMKLKLTMIVTIITILMMNVVAFAATTSMTTSATENSKIVTVSVTLDSNLKEGFFNLYYDNTTFKYLDSSENIKAVEKDGYIRVNANDDKLGDNYVATFKFELNEGKTTTSTFEIKNVDFTGKDNNPIVVEGISKNVTVEFKAETPETPETPKTEEPTTEPSEAPVVDETTKPSETTKPGDVSNKGEVGFEDTKPQRIPQAGTNVVPYIVSGVVVLMVAGILVINNKKRK